MQPYKPYRQTPFRKMVDKWLWTIGSGFIAFFPVETWLVIYKIIVPTTFIEKFLVFGAGVYMGGALQVFLFVAWLLFLFNVVWD